MSDGDNQAAAPGPTGSPQPLDGAGVSVLLQGGWALGKEGGLCQGRVRKGDSGRECGNARSPSARSLWGPFSSWMSPQVSIPFPQDSNLRSRRLLSAPVQSRGMERGRVAALSFAVIPARLEPWLAAPCRAHSSQHIPGCSNGSSVPRGTAVGSGHEALCLHRSLDGSWEQRNPPLKPGRTAQPFAKQKQLARLIKC